MAINGINSTTIHEDQNGYTTQRTGIAGNLVGGRIYSGGKAPRTGSFEHSTFKDPASGKTLTKTIIGNR
jgi:hypothetical protein